MKKIIIIIVIIAFFITPTIRLFTFVLRPIYHPNKVYIIKSNTF